MTKMNKCRQCDFKCYDYAFMAEHVARMHTTNTQPQTQQSGGDELSSFLWGSGMFDKLNHEDHVKLSEYVQAREREARADEVKSLPFKEGGVDMVHGLWEIYGLTMQERDERLQQLQPKPQAGEGGEV